MYFTSGHLTIWHKSDWNIGWDSCVGWTPLFFGNVLKQDEDDGHCSSHDPAGNNIRPPDYVAKLDALGRNRVIGAPPTNLGSWDLQTRDETDRILREFWIRTPLAGPRSPISPRGAVRPGPSSPISPRGTARPGPSSPTSAPGTGAASVPGMLDKDRFAHPSRGPFIPVAANAKDCREELWKLVEAYQKAHPAGASSSSSKPKLYSFAKCR